VAQVAAPSSRSHLASAVPKPVYSPSEAPKLLSTGVGGTANCINVPVAPLLIGNRGGQTG